MTNGRTGLETPWLDPKRGSKRRRLARTPSVRQAMQHPLAELAPLIWQFIGGDRLDGFLGII